MKKLVLIGVFAALCASCRSTNKAENYVEPEYIEVTQTMPAYTTEANFYQENIVQKASGDSYVVYEYADVRVDKVASLAADFCNRTNPGKKAYLRDIYMNKNYKRRATFDCVDLASK